MSLFLQIPYGNSLSDAFALARDRGILPTWMGTEDLRNLEAAIKERAVFSARTTNAVYLEELRKRILRFVENGYNGDQAQLRLELKNLLRELAYDPETGFPGDEALGIEPAAPGSLRDLSSDRRIDLILDTQLSLLSGKGQQQRGLEPAALDLFPAYELVRIRDARVPRNWFERWEQAGGTLIQDNGTPRMVALKLSEIWSLLGDTAIFEDALGVSYPPFAYGSGMGWEPVEADEWERLWKLANPSAPEAAPVPAPKPEAPKKIPAEVKKLPPATVGTHGMSRETLLELRDLLKKTEAKDGKLSLKSIFSSAPPPPPSRMNKPQVNAAELMELAEIHDQLDTELNAKRCGRSWIPDWKKCRKDAKRGPQGDLGADAIGQEGDWQSLGLPEDLRAVSKTNFSHRMDLKEARRLIEEGSVHDADPVGRKVTFGKITWKHLLTKEKGADVERARWMNHARRTLEMPLEIWEYKHRHYYIAKSGTRSGDKPFLVLAARVGERENEVISFHTKTWGGLNDDRRGKLLYTAY